MDTGIIIAIVVLGTTLIACFLLGWIDELVKLANQRASVLKWKIEKIGIDSADSIELLAHAIYQKIDSAGGYFWLMPHWELSPCPQSVVDRMHYERECYGWVLKEATRFQHRQADKLLWLEFDCKKGTAYIKVCASRPQPQPAVTTADAE